MLSHLVVKNIALIRYLDLEFSSGLTMMTGETGAGKSIMIDALSLVLGARADTGLIRAGADRAEVQATFRLSSSHVARAWLRDKALDAPASSPHDGTTAEPLDEWLFLRRLLPVSGRSRAFINETQVPLATMAALGALLVEIHGQHDHHTLLAPSAHRAILDGFANHPDLLQDVQRCVATCRDLAAQRQAVRQRQTDAADRRAFLAFQLDEWQAAQIKPGELAALELQHTRMAHATRLAEAAHKAVQRLVEGHTPATSLVGQAAGELESVTSLDSSVAPLADAVRSLHYELDDLGARIHHYLDGLETDPAQLEALGERIHLIHGMARKYRIDAEQLPALAQQWQQEMDAMDSADEEEKRLDEAYDRAEKAYTQAAQRLTHAREAAIIRLNQAMEAPLRALHMANTRFSAVLQPKPRHSEPHPTGMEEVLFRVSPNPGEPLKPLHLIASGGEISRITLAIKTTLARVLSVSTLVFDEVDVGVGGRVAASIGAQLAQIAQERQVLAVTHLPQVAAWGQQHVKIEKNIHHAETLVSLTRLTEAMRTEELARMLAGDQITEPARRHARELLQLSMRHPKADSTQNRGKAMST